MTALLVALWLAIVVLGLAEAALTIRDRRRDRPPGHHLGRRASSIDLARRIPAQRGPQPLAGGRGPTRHIRPTTRRAR